MDVGNLRKATSPQLRHPGPNQSQRICYQNLFTCSVLKSILPTCAHTAKSVFVNNCKETPAKKKIIILKYSVFSPDILHKSSLCDYTPPKRVYKQTSTFSGYFLLLSLLQHSFLIKKNSPSQGMCLQCGLWPCPGIF